MKDDAPFCHLPNDLRPDNYPQKFVMAENPRKIPSDAYVPAADEVLKGMLKYPNG